MNEVERRAYRDGQIDAKLQQHTAHLAAINGSQERTSALLDALHRTVDKMSDQLTGLLLVVPKMQTVAEKAAQTEEVAKALRAKTLEERTRWEQWRGTVAWTLGVATVLTTSANFWLGRLGLG